MVCSTVPSGSGHSAEAEALVYNFVKRKKPHLLLEMFGKERCQELEKRDHIYDRNSLLSMLEAIKGDLSVTKEDAPEAGEQKNHLPVKTEIKEASLANGDVPKRRTMKITPELAVFNYFHERQQEGALELLFDEKTRKNYDKKVDVMGIWMPSVRRVYAHYRFNELKKEHRKTMEIWNCELCKKEIKSHGRGLYLLYHIGIHEDIPCPCLIEGCDATLRSPPPLLSHLKKTHVLPVASLNSRQYYALKKAERQFCKRAETFRDKYFPPEAFIGFNDCKRRNMARDLEDPECKQCDKIVSNETARRRHVADHLKLGYNCVFDGCNYKAEPSCLSSHFLHKHSKKVGDLNEAQLFKYKQMKLNFAEIMKKEVPNYFSYKTELPEEELF
uniref:C2H2-type domain-containing protein n=1 Tax=Steinernema glaseri TaxID=37863 RepID=A0A1I7ZG00_9BILA